MVVMRFDKMNSHEYARLTAACPFTDDEQEIFGARRHGHSIVRISMDMGISTATVSRRIASIKEKINNEI